MDSVQMDSVRMETGMVPHVEVTERAAANGGETYLPSAGILPASRGAGANGGLASSPQFAGGLDRVPLEISPVVDVVPLGILGSFLGGVLLGLLLLSLRRWNSSWPPATAWFSRNGSSLKRGCGDVPIRVPSGVEVLTDRERVVKLLDRNGCTMRQSQLVEETGWSKAKVSRLLSRMEARGEITRIVDGRENIVYLGTIDESDDGPNRAR